MFNKITNLLIALMLFSVMFMAIGESHQVWAGKEEATPISIEELAGGPDVRYGIFSDNLFSFELLSLLLLAALIGSLYLAKKET